VTLPRKLRNRGEARKYVAGALATILRNDLDSGAHYLSLDVADDGNLIDEASERRAKHAAAELIAYLDKRAGKK